MKRDQQREIEKIQKENDSNNSKNLKLVEQLIKDKAELSQQLESLLDKFKVKLFS